MGFSELHVILFLTSLLTIGFSFNQAMYSSVGAIQYMQPEWDEVPNGQRLWPSLFYLFGIKDKR